MNETPAPAIPDYELLRRIGQGSYGDVWLARGVTGLYRAVKIVWRGRFADALPFEREFRGLKEFAALSLVSQHQLALLHIGRNDPQGYFYYVMELADDVATGRVIDPGTYTPKTLREVKDQRGRLPASEVIQLGVDLARGLAELHHRSLVHRDIKPSNVVFAGGTPKLADIGLVTPTHEAATFVGTEGYLPPEGPGAPSADIYSLGKLLYEIGTGLSRREYPRLPAELGAFPDRKEFLELNEVIVRACATDAGQRHRDASALLDDLLLLQAGRSVRRLRRAEKSLARAIRLSAILGLIALIAGIGVAFERERAEREASRRRDVEAERDALLERTFYAANLARVQRALDQDDYGQARTLLTQAQPEPGRRDLRGIEWHALRRQAEGDPCRILRANGAPIDRLLLSPDGQLCAVHDEAKSVELFDSVSGEALRKFTGIHRLAGFSADGQWLVGTDAAYGLQRWSARTGEPAGASRRGETYRPLCPVGPNGLVAFFDGRPSAVVVWDFARQVEVERLPMGSADDAAPWRFHRAATSPDGKSILLVLSRGDGADTEYRFTHISFGNETSVRHEPAPLRPRALGSMDLPDGRIGWWATDSNSSRLIEFNPIDHQWSQAATKAGAIVTHRWDFGRGAAFRRLQVIGARVEVYRDDDELLAFRGHGAPISGVAVTPSGDRFFSASAAGELRLWPLFDPPTAPTRQTRITQSGPHQIYFSSDGTKIFFADDGRVSTLDLRSMHASPTIALLSQPIGFTLDGLWGISPDRLRLACIDLAKNSVRHTTNSSTSAIVATGLGTKGRTVVFVNAEGELRSASATHGWASRALGHLPSRVWSAIAVDEINECAWLLSADRKLTQRSLRDGAVRWETSPNPRASDFRWLPESGEIIVATTSGEFEFYAAATGKLSRTIPSVNNAIQAFAPTSGGTRLIAADLQGDLLVIDGLSGNTLATLRPPGARDTIHNLAMAPDESAIAVIGNSGQLRVILTR